MTANKVIAVLLFIFLFTDLFSLQFSQKIPYERSVTPLWYLTYPFYSMGSALI